MHRAMHPAYASRISDAHVPDAKHVRTNELTHVDAYLTEEESLVSNAHEKNPYIDEWGRHLGYCNSCGDEGEIGIAECCDAGEVVPYDDDPDPDR